MSMPPFSPKAVIWDMDGTIFDTERIVLDSWVEVCGKHGYSDARAVVLSCIGRNMRESDDILRKNFGEGFDIAAMRKEKNEIMHNYIEKFGLPIKEGIVDALEWIWKQKIPTAIASSSDHAKILLHLKHAGLEKYFHVIVGGDQITHGKPHPEIFLLAAQKLGVVPKDCIVFEDSGNGVLSASASGMRVVMIPDLVAVTDDIAEHVDHLLKSGTEIVPLLSKMLAI